MACLLANKPLVGKLAAFKATKPARSSLIVRAEANTAAPSKPPSLEWYQDTENIRDVFAFAGPAPEIVNGRIAMIGFTSIALNELSSHTPALEIVQSSVLSVVFFSLMMTVASIVPKIVSGVSLKELLVSAEKGMPGEGAAQVLGFFNYPTELWTGRLAMIGFAGLLAVEAIKGDALF